MTDVQGGAGLTQAGLPVGDAVAFLRLLWAVDRAWWRPISRQRH